jgi:2-polyprenyl-6-methoxyphenol hydroxylase-like FAD-dependent oxidoreductase
VARAVGAQAYNEYPKEQGSYNTYNYFTGVKLDGVTFYSRPERMMYAWHTNDGRALVGLIQPGHAPRASRADVEKAFFAELDALAPELATRLRAGQCAQEWSSAATAAFCREAAGPGWCLVGDAGLTMDPVTAAGITNAMRDAETASELIHLGLTTSATMDEALAPYQARRDAASVPMLEFSQEMAKLAPPTEDVMKLFGALAGNQKQIDRYFGIFGQTVTPGAFFGPENMADLFAPQEA